MWITSPNMEKLVLISPRHLMYLDLMSTNRLPSSWQIPATCPAGICPPEPPLRPVRLGTSKCRLFLKQDQSGVEVLSLADSSGSGFLSFCEPHLMFVASGSRGQPVNAWQDQKTPEGLKTKPVCMHACTYGCIYDGWMDGCVKNNVTIETVKLLQDGWMDGWMGGWMDRCVSLCLCLCLCDGYVYVYVYVCLCVCVNVCMCECIYI